MRKLLPYEHQLIAELGISKEEYLGFVAAQFDHTRTPEEKLEIPQGDPAVVSLVITIVGALLQVASMLLMPKPGGGGQAQTRDQQFAPRYGFNSAQELAKYGDPLNLVYCNATSTGNPTGGVRVATSLIWSAVSSYGSSQFMQMLLALGAAQIRGIDVSRTAFGQTPIRNFVSSKTWAYYNSNGNIKFDNVLYPYPLDNNQTTDPTRTSPTDLVYRVDQAGTKREGFSQAFSPSTLTKFGVYAPIPIYVNVEDRAPSGAIKKTLIGITMDSSFRSIYWPSRKDNNDQFLRPTVPIGARFTLTFEKGYVSENDKVEVKQTASENRRAMLSGVDPASVYKLGSAKYKLVNLTTSDLDSPQNSSDALATFECVEAGICPEEDYETYDVSTNAADAGLRILEFQLENISLNNELLKNDPIYILPTISVANVEGEINRKTEELKVKIAALIDFEENGNKLKNFSDLVARPGYYWDSINNLIKSIDDEEEKLEGYRTDTIKDSRQKALIQTAKRNITAKEKELRRLFVDFYDGDYKSTRKDRALDLENLRKEIALISASNVSVSNGGRNIAEENARNDRIRAKIEENNQSIAYLEAVIADPEQWNDYFNTKALTKVEEAAYETITDSRIVKFSMKAQIYKRISGRSRKYGEKTEPTYKASDNGIKMRSSFFWFFYRRVGAPSYTRVPYIFTVRRGADVDNFIDLTFIAGDNAGKWQFKFEPIAEVAAEVRKWGRVTFAYIENSGNFAPAISNPDGTQIYFQGYTQAAAGDGYLAPVNNNPSQVDEWGLFSMQSDTNIQFSFDNGPELQIKAVTEQRVEALSTYPGLYKNMSLFGFNTYSGQNIQDLRSVSCFVTEGKLVRKLNDDGTYSATPDVPTSFAPEVFLDTVLDGIDGIGQYAKAAGIDTAALAKAKRFCNVNKLYFDGVIADQRPWRQFWAEVAPYSLLELGRIGGKETLVPAVPCDNAGNINRTVPITALFNAGNILEGTYREEFLDYGSSVQDLIASVIYRSTETDGVFPRNRSVDVQLNDVTEANAVRQTFNISSYVTNRDQAIMFAKLLCNQRRYIRKAIEFGTFPTDSPLSPGAYIYVDVGQNDWQGIYSGQVQEGGALNTPITGSVPNGTYNVLLYQSGAAVVTLSNVTISGNSSGALSSYAGWLFVLGTPVKSKRVFRITEVQMDEEGEVKVKAIEHPCDSSGQSLIANFDDALFLSS
jgi:hypothetical protein